MTINTHKTAPGWLPTWSDTWIAAILTIIVLCIGNGHDVLARYGLLGSSQLLHDQVSHRVNNGLGSIDSLSATKGLVLFGVWAIVGLLAFGCVHLILRTLNRYKFRTELSSDRYVHPMGFNNKRFWENTVLQIAGVYGLAAASIAGIVLYIAKVLPFCFARTRIMLYQPTLPRVYQLLLALISLFIATLVLYILVRLALKSRRFIAS